MGRILAARFLPILEALPHGALVLGPDGTVRACNHIVKEWLEIHGDLADVPFRALALCWSVSEVASAIHQIITSEQPGLRVFDVSVPLNRGDCPMRITMAGVAAEGDPPAILITCEDRTSWHGLLAQSQQLADDARAAERAAWPLSADESADTSLPSARPEPQVTQELLRHSDLERLQAESRRRSDFLAVLAHELRNPLAAIASALHIIRQRAPASDVALVRATQLAERQARHQARLLEDLLDVSRLELGKLELIAAPIDLATVIRRALEAIDFPLRARAQQLAVDLPPEPVIVHGDATRLEQVIQNLLGNAVKYTGPGGRISIELSARGAQAAVVVRDTGIGIAPDMLGRVFDLFVQGDTSLARTHGGLGIGLSLARRLIELHGGSIEARSPGRQRGSEFEFRVPLSHIRRPDGDEAPPPSTPRALRLVLIEDNRDAREILRAVLELQGHRVEEAGDGMTGLQLAVTTVPDAVLIDIGLPGMDGYETARRLRRRLGAAVRLIALSGYSDAQAQRASAEAGFDAHLVKPVDLAELVRTLTSP